jgi:hypothetical protein
VGTSYASTNTQRRWPDEPATSPDFPTEPQPDKSQRSVAQQPKFPGASPSTWNVPYQRNPFFTGREEVIKQLYEALRTGQEAGMAQPQALSGLGGIGKTQVAVEYAHRYNSDFQRVLWAKADSREHLISDFEEIAGLLNRKEQAGLPDPQEKHEQDQMHIVHALQDWLEENGDWLMILDNADDLKMIGDFIPHAGKGHLVLTTRTRNVGRIAQPIQIDRMTVEDGVLFLLRRARMIAKDSRLDNSSPSDREKAEEVFEALDGLPLTLDQAGSYIDENACGLSGYLERYQSQRGELLKWRSGLDFDYPESMATTWSLSFRKIEEANKVAADLLRFCAFLAPDTIPEEFITGGAPYLGPILQAITTDRFKLDAAIGELRTYSLLDREPNTRLLIVHRLVQAVLKDSLERIHSLSGRSVQYLLSITYSHKLNLRRGRNASDTSLMHSFAPRSSSNGIYKARRLQAYFTE